MKLSLLVKKTNQSGGNSITERRAFVQDLVVIGRVGADLNIDDRLASRNHCLIYVNAAGQARVRDMGSTNGTRMGKKKIVDEPIVAGTKFSIGGTVFHVETVEVPRNSAIKAAEESEKSNHDTITQTGVVLHAWPDNLRAQPKEKQADFLEYVDSMGTQTRLNLRKLRAQKKSG